MSLLPSISDLASSVLCCRRHMQVSMPVSMFALITPLDDGFAQWRENLRKTGLDLSKFDSAFVQGAESKAVNGHPTKTLQDLYKEVQQKEARLEMDAERKQVLRHIERVRVYLLAEVEEDQRCLVELERFDLRSGSQRTVLLPLGKKMVTGETWQEAMHGILELEVGLSSDQQRECLDIDEEGYIFYEEKYASLSYPEIVNVARVHEVQVRVKKSMCEKLAKQLSEHVSETRGPKSGSFFSDHPLERIGLPHGRDFVTKETSADGGSQGLKLHVWCWRSREYVRDGKIAQFEKYLSQRGVDVSCFGAGQSRSLFQFYVEVQELQESALEEAPASGGEVGLRRVVELLKIKLTAKVEKRKRILYSPWKVLADGRQRSEKQLLAGKMKKGEDWRGAVQQTLFLQLGVEVELQKECFRIDESTQVESEELRPSVNYGGISTLYKTLTVDVHVLDPEHPAMERFGLPDGQDFITKEQTDPRKSGRLHVWTWVPVVENVPVEEDLLLVESSFGQLTRSLRDAENLLQETRSDLQTEHVGLLSPLTRALEKIRHCMDSLSNIDNTLARVNVTMDRQPTNGQKPGGEIAERSKIVDFIQANFTRAAATAEDKHDAAAASPTNLRSSKSTISRSSRKNSTWTSIGSYACASSDNLQVILDGLENWGLDFFELNEVTGMHVLESYGEVVLVPMCHTALNCQRETSRAFLKKVASLYLANPYHNAIHATQVCHSAGWITRAIGLADVQAEIETMAFMIAAICHDVQHFGRNNAFCVSTEHKYAMIYNDSRVLENMHTATTFELLSSVGRESKTMVSELARPDKALLRAQIIEYILATDMSEHFEIISKFRAKRETPDFSTANESDRRFLARMCIKAGDIGHSALPWELHNRWTVLVTQEFFQQGDDERALGLPISALCDRENVGDVARSQKGFLEFVCKPLFEEIAFFQAPAWMSELEGGEDDEQPAPMDSTSTRDRVSTNEASSVSQCCVNGLKENVRRWLADSEASERILATVREFEAAESVVV
mmetsp:Transcript_10627/g.19706  ORF Transcript_10627/g.19706 Transcript_10627/m.19706 type:complete len:1016 (+) Transcript_10627:190-3237(+)